MSNRQDKIKERITQQKEFISARRAKQLALMESAYLVGLKLYEDNKDKLSEEEIKSIEAMKDEQLATLEKLKNEINQDPEA